MALCALIDRFVSRYTNEKMSHQYRAELSALFRHVGVCHPRSLTDAAVNQWVVCDSNDVGRRDELVLRLGLAGMRVAEIIHLRIGDLRLGHDPTIEWIGKKNRARKVSIGPGMSALLTDYLAVL